MSFFLLFIGFFFRYSVSDGRPNSYSTEQSIIKYIIK